jgi:hypothetical protein
MPILNNNYSTRVISVFVLPLFIYGLNFFEEAYRLPFFVVGSLVLLKALLDLKSIKGPTRSVQRKHHKQVHTSRPCYLCKKQAKNLIPYHAPGKRMAICSRCHACIQFTDRYT